MPEKREPNLAEAVEQGAVPCMEDRRAPPLDHEATPERGVGVEQSAPAPVVGGDQGHPDVADSRRAPPAQLGRGEAASAEEPLEAEPRHDRGLHLLERGQIEVVVVAVRDERGVDRRQLATRAGPAARSGGIPPKIPSGCSAGSTRSETPSSWTRKLAWPSQVIARGRAGLGSSGEPRRVGLHMRDLCAVRRGSPTAGHPVPDRPAEHRAEADRASSRRGSRSGRRQSRGCRAEAEAGGGGGRRGVAAGAGAPARAAPQSARRSFVSRTGRRRARRPAPGRRGQPEPLDDPVVAEVHERAEVHRVEQVVLGEEAERGGVAVEVRAARAGRRRDRRGRRGAAAGRRRSPSRGASARRGGRAAPRGGAGPRARAAAASPGTRGGAPARRRRAR